MRESTLAVHGGEQVLDNGPIAPPICPSSTYLWGNFEDEPHWVYSRYTNPNREALETVVAALEGATFGTAFGSGMAGIAACLELAEAGDHVLIADDIYGGTHNLGRDILPRHGIEVSRFNSLDASDVSRQAKSNTKLLIYESPTNPNLRIADISAVAAEAKKLGILVLFDNTFATPLLQKPLALGVDVVCHSTTKYLGGHSDVVGGVVVTNDVAIQSHLQLHARTVGGVPGPFDCWLVCRGIRSLVPRLRMQCESSLKLARFLASHRRVKRVDYPGLETHPGYDIAVRQMRAFGGVLSFDLDGSADEAKTFGERCHLFKQAASFGGVESMISYPPVLSHAGLTEDERVARGIPPTLLRVSIGLEDADDLIEDMDQALRA